MKQLFIQMSGAPGAGKTTIATAISAKIGAVILDHDVTKSAIMATGVPFSVAGKASYAVLLGVAKHLLQQGHNVILDSPCFYDELLQKGQQLAQEANATYVYIECVLVDLFELDRRLRGRSSWSSQVQGITQLPRTSQVPGSSGERLVDEAVMQAWVANMKRPDDFLQLDTSRPVKDCVSDALKYIEQKRLGSLT